MKGWTLSTITDSLGCLADANFSQPFALASGGHDGMGSPSAPLT
jgi:hypothetical protein